MFQAVSILYANTREGFSVEEQSAAEEHMNKTCFTTWIMFCCASRATAFSTYLDAFNTRYGTARMTLDSCVLCHQGSNPNSGPPQSLKNPYGSDFGRQPNADLSAIRTAFLNIESLDSDGDGRNNIIEINRGTFPGDPNDPPRHPGTFRYYYKSARRHQL
jgi:hypothetical protein